MNLITFIHRGAERIYDALAKFRKGHSCTVFAWEDDKFFPWDFPGERLIQASGAGEGWGVRLLAKTHVAVRYAAAMSGATAISEYDAVILKDPGELNDDTLYGSRVFSSSELGGGNYLAEHFMHAPWIATQAGWEKILRVMDDLRDGEEYRVMESGYPDRWLCYAAMTAGMKLESVGWSYGSIIDHGQHSDMLSKIPSLRTLHGIKHPETIVLVLDATPWL